MTKLIRIHDEEADDLKELCAEHGYSMSYIVSRLIRRLYDGEFSGSIHDVVRQEARPEPGAKE